MFILDESYKEDPDYPIKGSYTDRYLYYRGRQDDIDADVCEAYTKMYLSHPLISKAAEVRKQPGTMHKYEIWDGTYVYRGETLINCLQLLLQIVNYENPGEKITKNDNERIKRALQESEILNRNPKLRDKLELFAKLCYEVGNFFPIPYEKGYSLNIAKGSLKRRGNHYMFSDSSDTYFEVCYNYFVHQQSCCRLTRYIDEKYGNWKKRYCKEGGWEQFVEDNMFDSFVCDGKPIKMWNNTADGFAKDLERYLDTAITALSERKEKVEKAWKVPSNS